MGMNLKEALLILKSGEWCSLRVLTADVAKKKGGNYISIEKARICTRLFAEVPKKSAAAKDIVRTSKKNPNHNTNFTLNLEMPNKQIRKIHPVLITHLNNVPVL